MRIRLRTRFWATLFALVGVLAGTAVVVLVSLGRVAEADGAAAAAERAKHLGHRTAALVRDLYIHQTHVTIGGDPSHLDHYEPLVPEARAAAESLRVAVAEVGLPDTVGPIAAAVGAIDDEFRAHVLPALGRGDRAAIADSHTAVERLVDDAVRRIETLNLGLEAHAASARVVAKAAGRGATIAISTALAFAALLALLLGARLSRSITAPLEKLGEAAARLARGDRSARVAEAGDMEIAALATAFNEMAEDVARHEQRLVEARKLAALGQLAAGVAHEINNPLAVVLGRARLLRSALAEGGVRPEQSDLAAGLDAIAAEAELCRRIVADLLSLGQSHAEPPERFDVRALLQDAALRARATASRASGEDPGVDIDVPESTLEVVADRVRVRQIVDNLLRNAVEACVRRVHVRARVLADGGPLMLEVEDDGPGVPEADLTRVFEPFFTTKSGGTGLGLAVSQAAARALGGELRAERVADAQGGARFVLTLPLAAAPAAAEGA